MWKYFLAAAVIFLYYPHLNQALSCEALMQSAEPEANGTIHIQFVAELEATEYNDLISCLATIGQAPLPKDKATNVWRSLKRFYSRIDDIPVECYKFMGYALAGIPVDDFQNITLDNIDIVEVFGKDHDLPQEQMAAIAEAIIRDWTEKVPETLSEFDLTALGQILCHFNKSDILRIHPDAYKGAAQTIGELKNCPSEIVQAFAQLAIQPTAFGTPKLWSQYDLAQLGNVLQGLPPDVYILIPEEFIKDMKKNKKKNASSANIQ